LKKADQEALVQMMQRELEKVEVVEQHIKLGNVEHFEMLQLVADHALGACSRTKSLCAMVDKEALERAVIVHFESLDVAAMLGQGLLEAVRLVVGFGSSICDMELSPQDGGKEARP